MCGQRNGGKKTARGVGRLLKKLGRRCRPDFFMRSPLDPRQKEGASFRFLPEAENSISASSFFLFRRKPASLGFPAGVRGGRQAAPRKAQPTHAGTVASDQFDCQAAGESNGGPQGPSWSLGWGFQRGRGIETPSPLTAFFGTFFVRTKKVRQPSGGEAEINSPHRLL